MKNKGKSAPKRTLHTVRNNLAGTNYFTYIVCIQFIFPQKKKKIKKNKKNKIIFLLQ